MGHTIIMKAICREAEAKSKSKYGPHHDDHIADVSSMNVSGPEVKFTDVFVVTT